MATIDFREPPPEGRNGAWVRTLAPLCDHPLRWAVVKVGKEATIAAKASHLRRGRTAIPPGRWEFQAVGTELFARYLGPEDA